MNKRSFLQTKIKRGHLVLQFGVGSIVRSRQGVTALVAGLPEWEHTLLQYCNADPAERTRYLNKIRFKERELQAATGVDRFVPPPAQRDSRSWEIPLIRFPLAGVCANWHCQRVTIGTHGSPAGRSWTCAHCTTKRTSPIVQVPIFYACPAGHLDEIDFDAVIDHEPNCERSIARVSMGDQLESPFIRCATCGGNGRLEQQECSGGRPWLPTVGPESCDLQMEVVSRTSVKVYYGNTKSAIHIPLEADLDEDLLRYLDAANWDLVAFSTPAEQRIAADRLISQGWNVSVESAIEHIRFIRSGSGDDDHEWDVLSAREREFDVLASRHRYPALEASALISLGDQSLKGFSNVLVRAGLITHLTAVYKLTETRVSNGFSRISPRLVAPGEGRRLMWGRDAETNWLPGHRTYGEGIFIAFNATRLGQQGSTSDLTGRQLFDLSDAGTVVHTFAHALISKLAESAGYAVPSIRDRMYDVGDGRLGVLVYTAEGDSGGTLGGLVAHAEPALFDPLVEATLDALGWCAQDPVCLETRLDSERHIAAACHQCVLLPETSCELFNGFLDRGSFLSVIRPLTLN